MQNKLKNSFEAVKAEDILKSNTLDNIRKKTWETIEISPFVPRYKKRNRMLAAGLTALFLLLSGGLFLGSYNTAYAYVELDDADATLTVNCFNRVISVESPRGTCNQVLSEVNLHHMSSDQAVSILMETLEREGHFTTAPGDTTMHPAGQSCEHHDGSSCGGHE